MTLLSVYCASHHTLSLLMTTNHNASTAATTAKWLLTDFAIAHCLFAITPSMLVLCKPRNLINYWLQSRGNNVCERGPSAKAHRETPKPATENIWIQTAAMVFALCCVLRRTQRTSSAASIVRSICVIHMFLVCFALLVLSLYIPCLFLPPCYLLLLSS